MSKQQPGDQTMGKGMQLWLGFSDRQNPPVECRSNQADFGRTMSDNGRTMSDYGRTMSDYGRVWFRGHCVFLIKLTFVVNTVSFDFCRKQGVCLNF